MDMMEAIRQRHSVRRYTEKTIEAPVRDELQAYIAQCNADSGLSIQLITDEPTAFTGMMAKYGSFTGVRNYVALVGKKAADLDEKCGFWGEKVVLKAQQLGLNTCWVAMTFSKGKAKSAIRIKPGEKLHMVISLGYGETSGVPHKSKPLEALADLGGNVPDWFRSATEAAQLAPTAMNQQKFHFRLDGDSVTAAAGPGFYVKTDLGIAKCHFEIGAGEAKWRWSE